MRTLLFCILLTITFAQDNVPKETIMSQEITNNWIKKLGSDNFKERELATKKLIEIGEDALQQLREAENNKDAEISWRAKKIIKNIVKNDVPINDKKSAIKKNQKTNPFAKEFEYKGPGFHFKFKFSGNVDNIFRKNSFRKFFKQKYVPKDLFEDMDNIQKQMDQFFSGKDKPFKNFEKEFEQFFSKKRPFKRFEKRWNKIIPFGKQYQKKFALKNNFLYGLKLKKANTAIQKQLQLQEGQGLLIEAIKSEGILVNIGLEKWDLLLSVNKKIIHTKKELENIIAQIQIGKKVVIRIIRRGEEQEVKFVK